MKLTQKTVTMDRTPSTNQHITLSKQLSFRGTRVSENEIKNYRKEKRRLGCLPWYRDEDRLWKNGYTAMAPTHN